MECFVRLKTQMEHRWSRRSLIEADVFIYRQGRFVGVAQARNLSKHGMLLEIGTLAFVPNSVLKLEFLTRANDSFERHSMSAVVVHCDDGYFGVEFINSTLENML